MSDGVEFCNSCDTLVEYKNTDEGVQPYCKECDCYLDENGNRVAKEYDLESNGKEYDVPFYLRDRIYINGHYIAKNYRDDPYSLSIIQFKKLNVEKIEKFIEVFNNWFSRQEVSGSYLLCKVPPHEPQDRNSWFSDTSLDKMIKQLAKSNRRIRDGSDVLIRTKEIERLSMSGKRETSVHAESIAVDGDVTSEKIILLDDILTSGNSLIVCKRKLLEAGALIVHCFVLGRTV